jgi:hypothetical protein
MIVVTDDTVNDQFIYFIPRVQGVDQMYLTDESTNVTVNVPITNYTMGSYADEIEAVFPCKQNHFYRLVLTDVSNNEIYRDRIFCTNQTPSNYTPNQNTYVSVSSNNEFLMF